MVLRIAISLWGHKRTPVNWLPLPLLLHPLLLFLFSTHSWYDARAPGYRHGPQGSHLHRHQQGGPVHTGHRGAHRAAARARAEAAGLQQGAHGHRQQGRRCHSCAAVCPVAQVSGSLKEWIQLHHHHSPSIYPEKKIVMLFFGFVFLFFKRMALIILGIVETLSCTFHRKRHLKYSYLSIILVLLA